MQGLFQNKPRLTNQILFSLTALSALIIGGLFISNGVRLPNGAPALPLDDAYIHLQYAWQAAHGQFLQYNPGDAPSTGATSLLYMLVLVGGFLAGVGHDAMPTVELGLGLLLFTTSALLAVDTARQLAVKTEQNPILAGAITAVLFVGSGWANWAYFSGMETGLLITLVIAALWASLTDRYQLAALFGGLAALARPEAVLLPGLLFLAQLIASGLDRPTRIRRSLWAALPMGAGAVSPLINLAYTGSFSASGLLAKSLFTLVPFQWSSVYAGMSQALSAITFQLFGGVTSDGHWQVLPLSQVWALLGVWVLWRRPSTRLFGLACLGWVVAGSIATATLQTALWHHFRYQMPFYPTLLVLTVAGLGWLISKFIRDSRWQWALVMPALLWGLYALPDYAHEYQRDSHTLVAMQFKLADWLKTNTPADARVAVHDVGIIRYFGERYTIDVVGLTTTGMAAANRNGPGSLYEALQEAHPDYYAVYPNGAPPYFGLAVAADLLGKELYRVQVDDYSPYTSAGDTQIISRPNWSSLRQTFSPQQPEIVARVAGLHLTDAVNVADLPAEAEHDFQWWNVGEPAGFPTDVRLMRYRPNPGVQLADGGRLLTGGDSFTLNTLPDTGLLLVARLHQTVNLTLQVQVNDQPAGEWRLPALPGEWLESAFPIPADLITSAATHITLTVKDPPPDARYSPFYYWAYQGDLSETMPKPAHPTTVEFDDTVRLLGFDLVSETVTAGQPFDVSLDWQALAPQPADIKVFVHLLDPANDTQGGLVAQTDSAPRSGTYPFWVWQPQEVVQDTVQLSVPPDTKPGKYVLLIGLYDAVTDERLPVHNAPDFGNNRYVLTSITVQAP